MKESKQIVTTMPTKSIAKVTTTKAKTRTRVTTTKLKKVKKNMT